MIGLGRWYSIGGLGFRHWGAWLQALIKDKIHLLAPLHSWVRRELWPGEVRHSRTFLGVLVPPSQRCCCFWDFPAGLAPLARLSSLLLLRLLHLFLRSPFVSQGTW